MSKPIIFPTSGPGSGEQTAEPGGSSRQGRACLGCAPM